MDASTCCVKRLGQCVASGKQEHKSWIQVVLKPVCLPIVIAETIIIAFSLWLSRTAAILTDRQALAAVWSILLPEATCPILYQVTCQKEKQQCSCLLWFCPRFIYNKNLFLFHKPRFIFNFLSCFGGKKGVGVGGSNNLSFVFSH